jgi:hypothetical protein
MASFLMLSWSAVITPSLETSPEPSWVMWSSSSACYRRWDTRFIWWGGSLIIHSNKLSYWN